jgi:hypothetical protein
MHDTIFRFWFFVLWYHVALLVDSDISEEHTISILKVNIPTCYLHPEG